MKERNLFAIAGLTIVTFGIYQLVWYVKTKDEMVKNGADVPTAWFIIIPLVNIWWLWKYSKGVEHVTNNQLSGLISFILLVLLDSIGMLVIQHYFNKVATPAMTGATDKVPSPESVAAEHSAGMEEPPQE